MCQITGRTTVGRRSYQCDKQCGPTEGVSCYGSYRKKPHPTQETTCDTFIHSYYVRWYVRIGYLYPQYLHGGHTGVHLLIFMPDRRPQLELRSTAHIHMSHVTPHCAAQGVQLQAERSFCSPSKSCGQEFPRLSVPVSMVGCVGSFAPLASPLAIPLALLANTAFSSLAVSPL